MAETPTDARWVAETTIDSRWVAETTIDSRWVAETTIDSRWVDKALGADRPPHPRLPVDRARGLLLLGLLGAALVVLWLRLLAAEPHLPLVWRAAAAGGVTLDASTDAALQPAIGHRLQALVLADGRRIEASTALLPRSPRWIVDDADRSRYQALRALVGDAAHQPRLTLLFEPDLALSLVPRPRGLGGLGAMGWLMGALALALALVAAVVVLAAPSLASALFAVMALAQSINLLLIGAELLPGMGLPAELIRHDLALRLLADATAVAAVLHAVALYPTRLPLARWLAAPVWGLALGAVAWALLWPPAGVWWWAQALAIGYGAAAVAVLRASRRRQGSPLAALLQRLAGAGTGTLLLFSLAMASASHAGLDPYTVATVGSVVWYVFFALLLMLAPFLSRSRQVLRELAVLAGVSTVASSLDLLLEAVFSFSPLVSLLLALAASLLLYLALRTWILGQLAGSGVMSTERMFDSLYRVARELEQAPEQAGRHLSGLLREVFDPLEMARTDQPVSRTRVADDGSTLVVPIPTMPGPGPAGAAPGAIVLRFARRGRRLFNQEDISLAERLIEQLRRAVAYDRAVEHGRVEERSRIAQDLHDDIGARLLTLMYKAPNPEIEEYIRHTLQDLKTLTRGLAAANQRLSHAAAEWKSDITQRLAVTGCDLHWSFSADRDLLLSVVQWSGLTRVLRELVNNIISHAQASQVDISAHFDRGRLTLLVSDDGIGRAPETWSHGLGLGGVRKRVKLLGGQVVWVEQAERGIRCEVRVPLSSEKG